MINAYQPQHIFYLFTEKLNTSEPPPDFQRPLEETEIVHEVILNMIKMNRTGRRLRSN